jgi:hypothetical protein
MGRRGKSAAAYSVNLLRSIATLVTWSASRTLRCAPPRLPCRLPRCVAESPSLEVARVRLAPAARRGPGRGHLLAVAGAEQEEAAKERASLLTTVHCTV